MRRSPQSGVVRMRVSAAASGATVIDDSYNANPISMEAALATLGAFATRAARADMGRAAGWAELRSGWKGKKRW